MAPGNWRTAGQDLMKKLFKIWVTLKRMKDWYHVNYHITAYVIHSKGKMLLSFNNIWKYMESYLFFFSMLPRDRWKGMFKLPLTPPSWGGGGFFLSSEVYLHPPQLPLLGGDKQKWSLFFFPQWPKGLRINIDLSKKNYNRWSWYKFDRCSLRLSVMMKIRQALNRSLPDD